MSDEGGDAIVSTACVQDTPVPVSVPVIMTMANMINYLSASMYQGLFTYNHERAWARLNEIYAFISNTPDAVASKDMVEEFRNCVASLENVTETDDADYYNYMRRLRQYSNSSSAIAVGPSAIAVGPAASEKEPPSSTSCYYNDSDSDSNSDSNSDSDSDSDGELEIDMMRREMTEWTAQIRWRNR
jgi:hypothetical protein